MFGLRRRHAGPGDADAKPALTARWLRDVLFTNRLAFEREMQRDRRRLERRFEAYMEESIRQDPGA